MTTSNTTREEAERFARWTSDGAHMQQPLKPLTGEEIKELMRRAAPGANQLLRDLEHAHRVGWSRARGLLLR